MQEQATEARGAKPGGLSIWIRTASHGLCAQAKERVSKEIRAHHAEAFAELCDTGLSPEAAYALAVEGLGDATAANKAFRKTYLTTWQQAWLADLAQPLKTLSTGKYAMLVFQVCIPPTFALYMTSSAWHLQTGDHTLWITGNALVAFCCLGWFAIAGFWLAQGLDDGLRQLRRRPLRQRPTAINRIYPWFLMACLMILYAAWQIQRPYVSFEESFAESIILAGAASPFAERLHRSAQARVFSQSWRLARIRNAVAMSYGAFLALAGMGCLYWSSSWRLITALLGWPFSSTGQIPSSLGESSEILMGFSIGLIGATVAAMLFFAAIRWFVGIHLLRKEISGQVGPDSGSPPCPETPLGE